MNKKIKIASILHAIIFSCAVLLCSSWNVNAESPFHQSSSADNQFTFVSNYLYIPVSTSQDINNGLNKLPTVTRYNHLLNFDLSNRSKELLLAHAGTRYIYYSLCIINISLIPPDIIFPFNYFW